MKTGLLALVSTSFHHQALIDIHTKSGMWIQNPSIELFFEKCEGIDECHIYNKDTAFIIENNERLMKSLLNNSIKLEKYDLAYEVVHFKITELS